MGNEKFGSGDRKHTGSDEAGGVTGETRQRDPAERRALEDAFKIAGTIVDKAAEGETVDSEVYTLAAGFLVLAGDIAAMLDAATKATHFCGWCQRANGDSRIDLPTYTLDEVREHTVKCEHNPVAQTVAAAKSALSDWDWDGLVRDAKRGDFDSAEDAFKTVARLAALLGVSP